MHRKITYTSIFTALTAVGAFIKIPFPYVPFTLQTFFVLLAGNLLGARFGALSQIIYISLGLIGLPIFSFGGGFGYVFQPTFGYLIAYPIGAFISGKLIQLLFKHKNFDLYIKEKLFFKVFWVNFLSVLIIFVIGVSYLYLNIKYILGKEIGFTKAFLTGFVIFLPGDILKVILVSLVTIKIKKYLDF